jgi:hypothetical protein
MMNRRQFVSTTAAMGDAALAHFEIEGQLKTRR